MKSCADPVAWAGPIHLPCDVVGGWTAMRLSQEVKFEGDLRRCVTEYRIIGSVHSYGKSLSWWVSVSFILRRCEYLVYIASNCRNDWWIVKDFEASGRDRIGVVSRNLPGWAEKNHGNLSQDSWWPGQVSKGHYATSRKVAGSIPDKFIGFLNWPNPSSRLWSEYQEFSWG
jgi:hypothetical protein